MKEGQKDVQTGIMDPEGRYKLAGLNTGCQTKGAVRIDGWMAVDEIHEEGTMLSHARLFLLYIPPQTAIYILKRIPE